MNSNKPSRRDFLKLTALGGSGLILGIPIVAASTSGTTLLPLVRVGADGHITLFAQNPDMGQGVKTALPMIIAEELDVDWSGVTVEQSDLDARLENQFSGGSLSVRLNFDTMRRIGASARQMLLQAAADRWRIPVSELRTRDGRVLHDLRGSLGYGELAEAAAALQVPDDPPLKTSNEFRIVGHSISDVDIDGILTGAQQFSQDLRLPGMLYAVVKRSPCSDGRPVSFDAAEAAGVDGVIGFEMLQNEQHGGRIALPNSPNFVSGVAVIANSTWAAMQGAQALNVEWQHPDPKPDSERLMAEFESALHKSGELVRDDGNVETAAASDAVSVNTTYRLPFLAHIPMEPMNCTVDTSNGRVVVWAPTQEPQLLVETLVATLGVEYDAVTVHVLRSGGGFGRRYYADFAVDAAILSRRLKRPVKVVWTREDDIRHDYFRPASLQRIAASVDESGRIAAWDHKVISHARSAYLERGGVPTELDDYEFPAGFVPNLRYEYVHAPARIPLGQWRAITHSSNVFVVASAIDELAQASGVDPVEFLLRLVGNEQFVRVREDFQFDASRLVRVIELAASAAGWTDKRPDGIGYGIAASYNQGAWVAEVAQVSVRNRALRIERIVAAIDCGLVINPQAAINQVQGAIVDGISSALLGEITVSEGIVDQGNFHDYGFVRIGHIPDIDVQLVDSDDSPRGLGEAPLPPVAPAICNAICDATGQRIRELPLKKYFTV